MAIPRSTATSILRRIRGNGQGWVFTPSEFLDLGNVDAITQALSRLVRRGYIRRIARGIYDYPKKHQSLGLLSPNPDAVAAALAVSTGSRIQISGARAANLFGLTSQVPAQLVYLTDGPPRRLRFRNQTIVLKHASPSRFVAVGTPAGLAIQAIHAVGPTFNKELLFQKLATNLKANDQVHLLRMRRAIPKWSQAVLDQLRESINGKMGN